MRILSIVLCSLFCGSVFAADFKCDNHVAAVYSPGPNWADLKNAIPDHTQFISNRMDAGDMLEGGPFFNQQGMTGGFMVYASADTKVVEELVKQDPLVQKNISTYELRVWMKCTK